MPVQPDRTEPVIAEPGDSAKDTVCPQLYGNAGEKKDAGARGNTDTDRFFIKNASFKIPAITFIIL